MMFSLEPRRARSGDCLLLHYGTAADPGLIVIDGGPAQVYQRFLRPRLASLKAQRAPDDASPLPIDAVIVSHIDGDHIVGILELTRELVNAKDLQRPRFASIRSIWHNTFDDIVGNSAQELTATVTEHFGAAALAGEVDVEGLEPSAAMVLASVGQGLRLRDDLRKLGVMPNALFGGRLIMTGAPAEPKNLGRGLTMTIAGPTKEELEKLAKEHDAFLEAQKAKAPASLASFTDTSVTNLSSIIALAEADGKRVLLTGDARGDCVLSGLEQIGAMKAGGTIDVDVLKMPHHGSSRNVAPDFFDRIRAKHYVFSGDGEHGNPDRDTMEMLAASAPADAAIHLTYPLDEIDAARRVDWTKEQQKEKARAAKSPKVDVRPDWSPADHGLVAFFDAHPDLKGRVRIVDAAKPHVIDLLEPIAF